MTFKIADRVRDTSATTGTGTYTISGTAPDGFRTFLAGIGDGNSCLYCVTDGVDFEINKGVYSDTPKTLTRATLIASSTGSAIIWAGAGPRDVFVDIPASYLMALLAMKVADVGATTLPTLSGGALIALGPNAQATNVLAVSIGDGNVVSENRGAAVGGSNNLITGAGGGIVGGSGCQIAGYNASSAAGLFNEAAADVSMTSGDNAKTRFYGSTAQSSGTLNNAGETQREVACAFKNTTNATPANLYPSGDAGNPLTIPDGFLFGFRGSVAAIKDNGDAAYWVVQGAIKRISGTVSLVGSVTKTQVAADAGASTWDIALTADDGTDKCLQVQVTGQATSVIQWHCELVLNEVVAL